MHQVRRTFIDWQYGQLHMRTAGDVTSESAIICLHMMPKSSRGFEKLMPELARHCFTIAPDYPGYGESSHFPKGHVPCIQDYVDSIDCVIREYRLKRIYLIGYHTGSMIAVELANRHPDLVSKLIIIGAPILTKDEVEQHLEFFAPIPLDEDGNRFRVMWERIMHFRGPGFTLEMAADSMAENLRGGERYEEGHAAAFNYCLEFPSCLRSVQQAVWVMNISDDLFEFTKRIDSYLNNGYRTDFPELGNGCLLLHPKLVAAHMLDFINQK